MTIQEQSERICAIVQEESGVEVTVFTPIEEIGLDSLEFVNLLQAIENGLGCRINEAALPLSPTVGDIVSAVLM